MSKKNNKKEINKKEEIESSNINGGIKAFKYFITLVSIITLIKSVEQGSSFDTMTGITIAGVYDYFLLLNSVNNHKFSIFINYYAKIGVITYFCGLAFSLAGSLGVIIEKQDLFIISCKALNNPTLPKSYILVAFLILLGYNYFEAMIPIERKNISRVKIRKEITKC